MSSQYNSKVSDKKTTYYSYKTTCCN